LQAIGKSLQVMTLSALGGLALGLPAQAQETQASEPESAATTATGLSSAELPEQIPEDYYRAELLIIERKVAPEDVSEKMGVHTLNLTPEQDHKLLTIAQDGTETSTLNRIPEDKLHLSSAAQRLTRSGRFNVLALTGWYQAFPPDYEGNVMQVALGDWLENAGHREVEGTITIDRQRYLHVNVNLNHWYASPSAASRLAGPMPATTVEPAQQGDNTESGDETGGNGQQVTDSTVAGEAGQPAALQDPALAPAAELLTWIRETRRMRSGEVHFLDSPTLGVLVYFSPIEPRDEQDPRAAPPSGQESP
jgi:hypothetical protein